jgi:hypothetical protein
MDRDVAPACPISGRLVDGSVARVNGVIVCTVLVAAFAVPLPWLLGLLAVVFGLKVFAGSPASPLHMVSRRIARLLEMEPVMVDAAPKRFAAGLGLTFTLLGLVAAYALGSDLLFYMITGAFAVCAGLEGFAGYCVGCGAYQLLAEGRARVSPARD